MKGLLVFIAIAHLASSQVTNDRLLASSKDSANWLTYSGRYEGWRYSELAQISASNAAHLKLQWAYQMPTTLTVETSPIVADGVMYISEPPSNVVALDARTGRQYWRYRRELPTPINVCCGQVNRGVAILGNKIFIGTVDAHLVALDARTGAVLWDVQVADHKTGHAITGAPLIVKDMVISGIAAGSMASVAFWMLTTRPQANAAGAFGRFPSPASQAAIGRANLGRRAVVQPG